MNGAPWFPNVLRRETIWCKVGGVIRCKVMTHAKGICVGGVTTGLFYLRQLE